MFCRKSYSDLALFQNHDMVCVLHTNGIYRQIFLFLYFWNIFVAIMTAFILLLKTGTLFCYIRAQLLCMGTDISVSNVRTFVPTIRVGTKSPCNLYIYLLALEKSSNQILLVLRLALPQLHQSKYRGCCHGRFAEHIDQDKVMCF